MNQLLRACLFLPLLLVLGACTGTDEPPAPTRLVTLEGDATLRATDVGTSAPAVTVTAPNKVIGIATVANGAKLAVAYADRLEFRDADLNVLGTPVTYPPLFFSGNFTPGGTCFARLATDPGGTRLAVYEACPGRPDVLALYDSVGTLRYQAGVARVPTDLSVPNVRLGLTVLNDTIWVALPSADPARSEVLRVTPAVGCDFTRPFLCVPDIISLTPAPTYTPQIGDLAATVGGAVYATTAAGLVTLPAAVGGVPTASTPTGQTDRVWVQRGVLAVWNAETSALTIANAANLAVRATPTVNGLLDLVVTQDNYLYTLQPGGLACYDVVQPQYSTCPAEASTNVSVNVPRELAWVLR